MKKILLYNYKEMENSWDFVPHFVWEEIVHYSSKFNSSFGFRYLKSEEDIHKFSFFDSLERMPYVTSLYTPSNIPGYVEKPENYNEQVLLFKLNEEAANKLRELELDTLCIDSENPTEEIVIFKGTAPLLIATNIDSNISFPDISEDDYNSLISSFPDLKQHIYDC